MAKAQQMNDRRTTKAAAESNDRRQMPSPVRYQDIGQIRTCERPPAAGCRTGNWYEYTMRLDATLEGAANVGSNAKMSRYPLWKTLHGFNLYGTYGKNGRRGIRFPAHPESTAGGRTARLAVSALERIFVRETLEALQWGPTCARC